MDRESEAEAEDEINTLIEKLSSSGIEFRKTTSEIIFKRLSRQFAKEGQQITRESLLTNILPVGFNETHWDALEQIGFKIPGLRRSKVFYYLKTTYLVIAFCTLVILTITNFKLVFVVWGLPIFGMITMVIFSPVLVFMLLFKRRHLPCDTVGELIDQIISVNWTDLISNDKQMFKDLVRQEEELSKRVSN